jgi:hypothetical protein
LQGPLTKKTVQPAPENNLNALTLKEQLKQYTPDRYDLQHIFNAHPNTILNWCNKGILSYCKIGRKRLFNAEQIKQQLEVSKQIKVPGGADKKEKMTAVNTPWDCLLIGCIFCTWLPDAGCWCIKPYFIIKETLAYFIVMRHPTADSTKLYQQSNYDI